MGVRPGDVLLSLNGEPIGDVTWLVGAIARRQQGDTVSLSGLREGKSMRLTGVLQGLAPETSPHARVIYDAVPFEDGLVRTIIHVPPGEGRKPVLFFIQGNPCQSMDRMQEHHSYQRLLNGFSEKGYVVVKTEKPGVGDSRSGRNCHQIDLFDEVGVFEASYNALAKYDFVDTGKVFVFGFSTGGVVAPLMQTRQAPLGIIVFGTVVRPWFDYFTELVRIQRLLRGEDYLVNEAGYERALRFFYRFMVEKESPESLARDADMLAFMNRFWQVGEDLQTLNGRHYTFWQQLQDARLFTAWSRTPASVLSLWGASDAVAFNAWEHQLIADIVNHYGRPGQARFMVVPQTDHNLLKTDDQRHSLQIINDWEYHRTHFNPEVIETTHGWMTEIIKKNQGNP
jgi:hypothetical protein